MTEEIDRYDKPEYSLRQMHGAYKAGTKGGKLFSFGKEHTVLCPVCGFDFTHIREVKTVSSNDNYEAGWWGRGDLLVVVMSCEEGHYFELCIGFHKGQNFMFTRPDEKHRTEEE